MLSNLVVARQQFLFHLFVLEPNASFHLRIPLLQHLLVHLFAHSELHHPSIVQIGLFPSALHPLGLFPGLLDLLHHAFLFLLQHFDPVFDEQSLFLVVGPLIVRVEKASFLTQFLPPEVGDVWRTESRFQSLILYGVR